MVLPWNCQTLNRVDKIVNKIAIIRDDKCPDRTAASKFGVYFNKILWKY